MDVETTTHLKGFPFSHKNQLCLIVIGWNGWSLTFTPDEFHKAKEYLQGSDIWITFNGKFDIHWIKRQLGITPKSVWDCQIAEFLFSGQEWAYPSLDEACAKRGLPRKLDIVKTEYWDKGIDTPDIPIDILKAYAIQDRESTYELYQAQCQDFDTKFADLFKLFRVQCNDLLVLQEMEFNGILYNVEGSKTEALNLETEIAKIDEKLINICQVPSINFSSRQQVSKFLYGGILEEEFYAPIGVFKTGIKVGQTKYKKMVKEYILPRLIEPLEGSEKVAEGIYATDEDTLVKLKTNSATKKIVNLLLERAKLAKLNSTYLLGIPKTLDKYDCLDNIIHTTFNQCTVVSGRLSSTKPNVQNQPPEAKQYCVTRFP